MAATVLTAKQTHGGAPRGRERPDCYGISKKGACAGPAHPGHLTGLITLCNVVVQPASCPPADSPGVTGSTEATDDPCAGAAGAAVPSLCNAPPTTVPAPVIVPLKPILKWAGGKRWLAPILQRIWAHHSARRLVEPLCGGLAVTLALRPTRALLNDANPHLINFYRWVQNGLTFNLPMKNDKDTYYAYRARFNELIRQGRAGTSEAAQLFFYLNRTGYNGLCRFNRRGEFNVPFGKYKQVNYEIDLTPYRQAFAGWEFRAGDFEAVPLEKGDFVYADPPYDVEFTQYSQAGFSWDDQIRLAEWLARHSGPVVLSNQATERVVALYERLGFRLNFVDAPRMISCTGDRTPAREVIAFRGV